MKLLEKLPFFRVQPSDDSQVEFARTQPNEPVEEVILTPPMTRPRWWTSALMLVLAIFFAALFARMIFPALLNQALEPNESSQSVSCAESQFFPPLRLFARAQGLRRIRRGREGRFRRDSKIIPFLVIMLVAINMFKGAGGIDLLTHALSPILAPLHFPPDPLPLALMRPLSGGATLAILTDVVHRLGPESIVSLMAATIYGKHRNHLLRRGGLLRAVGVKQTRHSIPAGLLGDLAGVIPSVVICRAVLS